MSNVSMLKAKYGCAKGDTVLNTAPNSVAKFAGKFNNSVVMEDRKRAAKSKGQRKMKHKGKIEC